MKYTLIKGTFHVVGQSPDADSIKFRAANDALWNLIDTDNREAFNRTYTEGGGVVNTRLEGIDALETHYTPPAITPPIGADGKPVTLPKPKGFAQPSNIGRLATNRFLEFMGVKDVKWRVFGKSVYIDEANCNGVVVKDKLKDAIPGFIITGDVELNGRPMTWVFPGTVNAEDGVGLSREQLGQIVPQSANFYLVRLGMVYPFFFMSLPAAVRIPIAKAAQDAQMAAQAQPMPTTGPTNIWQFDFSTQGVEMTSVRVLTEQKAFYPYIFRKVIKHYNQVEAARFIKGTAGTDESVPLDGFFNDANPHVFVISDQDFMRLDDVLEAHGTTLRMRKQPYDLVFLS